MFYISSCILWTLKANLFVNTFDWRGLRCMTPGWGGDCAAGGQMPAVPGNSEKQHSVTSTYATRCSHTDSRSERVRDWASAFINKDSESSAGSLPFHVQSARNHPAANAKNKDFLSLTDVATWKLFCVYFFTLLLFSLSGSWEKVPGFFKAWQVDRQELVQRVCNLNTQLSEVFPIIQADTCGSKTRGR